MCLSLVGLKESLVLQDDEINLDLAAALVEL